MIRKATIADRGRVVELLRDFYTAAGFEDPAVLGVVVPFDPEHAARLFFAHVRTTSMTCLVLEEKGRVEGILLAVAYDHHLAPIRVSDESAFWIDPAHRGTAGVRMMNEYERWAKEEQRCRLAGLTGLGAGPDVSSLYLRRRYIQDGTHFVKVL